LSNLIEPVMDNALDIGRERRLGEYGGHEPGPSLVLVGGMHGNEPAGVLAIRETFDILREGKIPLRGKVHGLAGNLKALRANVRYIDVDLNRMWLEADMARAGRGALAESEELRGLKGEISRIADAAQGPLHIVDFHSFSGEGPPFVISDNLSKHPRFFDGLPMPIIIGLSPMLPGTMINFLSHKGHRGMAVEGGRHTDQATITHLVFFIWLLLLKKGLLDVAHAPMGIEDSWDRLEALCGHLPPVIEAAYRHRIDPVDEFEMMPGFKSFDPVQEGQPLARDRRGIVYSPMDGCILMPLYQGQGSDGFFIGQPLDI